MNFNDLFEAPFGDKFRKYFKKDNIKPLNPDERKVPQPMSDKDIVAMNKPAGPTSKEATGNWEHLLKHLTMVILQYKPHKSQQQAEDEAMNFIAAENQRGIKDPKQIISDLWKDLDAMPDEFAGYVDDKTSDDLDANMKSRFDNMQQSVTKSKQRKMVHQAGPDERGTKIFSVPETMSSIRRGIRVS